MVSVLDSRSSGPRSGPVRGHCVVFLSKTLLQRCLSPPRCTNGYRRIAGGNTASVLASHPGGSKKATPSCFMPQKPG